MGFPISSDIFGQLKWLVKQVKLLQFKTKTPISKLTVITGTNASAGTVVLSGATTVVNTTAVTANSIILLTCQVPAGTPGFLRISATSTGTSFTITSSTAAVDTSTVGWLIIN
jgi:hypothetical protein